MNRDHCLIEVTKNLEELRRMSYDIIDYAEIDDNWLIANVYDWNGPTRTYIVNVWTAEMTSLSELTWSEVV